MGQRVSTDKGDRHVHIDRVTRNATSSGPSATTRVDN
jgi:hypothetical protein